MGRLDSDGKVYLLYCDASRLTSHAVFASRLKKRSNFKKRGYTSRWVSIYCFAIGPPVLSQPVSSKIWELHDVLCMLYIAETGNEDPDVPYWSRQFDYERQDFQVEDADEDADEEGPTPPASAHDTPDNGPVLGANVDIAKAISMALGSLPVSPEPSRQVGSLVPASWEPRNGTISLASAAASPARSSPPAVPTPNESVPATPPAHANAGTSQKTDHHEAGQVAAGVSVASVPTDRSPSTTPCPDPKPKATRRGRKRAAATVSNDAGSSKRTQTLRSRKGQTPANSLVVPEKRIRKVK